MRTQLKLFDVAATNAPPPRLWMVYRRVGNNLAALVKDAIADFYQRSGALPVGARVCPKNVDTTRAALASLDLVNLSQRVLANGGTLACEVELG